MQVILFVVDCGRADHFDGTSGLTPRLDALRSQGTTFTQAFSQSQNTLSSHVSMLTSNYLFQHGVYSNFDACELPEHALPRRLAERGFTTRAFTGVHFLARGLGDQVGPVDVRFPHEGEGLASRLSRRFRRNRDRIAGHQNVEAGLRWLDQEAGRGDTFLWLHEYDTHMPYDAPRPLLRRHVAPGRASRSCREQVEARGWTCSRYPEYQQRVPIEHFPARYRAAVAYVDQYLDRLVAGLRKRGLWEDTLLIVTADHGECLEGEHGLYCMHQKLFDTTVHVPLWIRFPGGAHAGAVVHEMVELVDLAPTVAHAAGFDEPLYMGRDLGAIAAGDVPGREFAYAEHVGRLMHSVRDREHLWVEPLPDGTNREGIPLDDETLFLRDGTPVPDGSPQAAGIVERLECAARELTSSRPEVARAWGAHGSVDEHIAEQLRRLGYL